MPYTIAERDGEFCVFKKNADDQPEGDTLGCHATRPEAEAQVAALYANEPAASKALDERYAVKALGANRLGGYLVLWGSPEQKDLSGEYFTPETEGLTQIIDAVGKWPMYYQHGKDEKVGFEMVGAYDLARPDEVGLWTEAQLSKNSQYRAAIRDLINKRALGQSAQVLISSRKAAPDGKLERWIIAEGTLTPTPMEPRMMEHTVTELKGAYKSIGVEFPLPEPESQGDEESRRKELELERERLEILDL